MKQGAQARPPQTGQESRREHAQASRPQQGQKAPPPQGQAFKNDALRQLEQFKKALKGTV